MKDEQSPLRAALELAREGKLSEAIALLETALARTRSTASRPANTPLLAKTAGLLSEQDGNLLKAASYYEEALATEGPEPVTFVAMADIYFRLYRVPEAQECLARAESLAQSTGDKDNQALVAAARAKWSGRRDP